MELIAQGVRPEDVDLADRAAIIKAEEVCPECYLLCMLHRGADNSQYFQLKVDLSNDMTKGTDNYPKKIAETMRLLTDYVPPPRLQRVRDPEGEGLAFIQGEGRPRPGRATTLSSRRPHQLCCRCRCRQSPWRPWTWAASRPRGQRRH
jgi:hypothetical protein